MSSFKKPKFVEKKESGNDRDSSQEHKRHHRDDKRYYDTSSDPYTMDDKKINAHTSIEALPQVRKNPPNELNFKQKLAAINKEIASLKEERTKEKDKFKDMTKQQRVKIDSISDMIKLGQDCIRVLQKDVSKAEAGLKKDKDYIADLESRISHATRKVSRKEKKPIENMSYNELKQEIDKLELRLISETLDKKSSEAINRDINKLKTLQVNAPQQISTENGNSDIVQRDRQRIHQLKDNRNKTLLKKLDTEFKIDAITNQLLRLEKEKSQLTNNLDKLKHGEEYSRAKEIKEKILSLRRDRENLELKFQKLREDYEEQQKKIRYIMWANEIKKQKKEEEDYQKERRKKDKQREQYKENKDKEGKNKEGKDKQQGKDKQGKDKGAKGKAKDIKDNPDQQQKRFRPPPPHPFANQISDCRFLISYCENIKPKLDAAQIEEKKAQDFDLKEAISQGQWAKQKGITIIESKKKNLEQDEVVTKKSKKVNKSKPAKELLPTLDHTIEIVRMFDALKIVPPAKNEEIDSAIQALQTKAEYYKKAERGSVPRAEDDEPKAYRKKEDDNRPKKINLTSSDFPSL